MKDCSSPKHPRAGSAYAKAVEGDWPAQEALSRAQKMLKAFGVALRHVDRVTEASGILLASLTEVSIVMEKTSGDVLARTMEAQQIVIDDFAKILVEGIAEAREKGRSDGQKISRQALAELDRAQREYEEHWQAQTGLTPPRYSAIEQLEQAIDWWKEQAALVGISPDRILDAGEQVQQEFEPIIKGRLRLLRLQTAAVITKEISNQHLLKEADWHDLQAKLGRQAPQRDCRMGTTPQGQTDMPKDTIPTTVVLKDYAVSRHTLYRYIRNNRIRDYRPQNAPKNAPYQLSRAEIEKHFRRK